MDENGLKKEYDVYCNEFEKNLPSPTLNRDYFTSYSKCP